MSVPEIPPHLAARVTSRMEELIARSMTEDVELPDGRLLVRGLKVSTKDQAIELRARHERYEAEAAERARDRHRQLTIGRRISGHGVVWDIGPNEDGELVASTVHVTVDYQEPTDVIIHHNVPVPSTVLPDKHSWATVRSIAEWVGARRTRTLSTLQRDAHRAVIGLAWRHLRTHPLPPAPVLLVDDDPRPTNPVPLGELERGDRVWTNTDVQHRIDEYEGHTAETTNTDGYIRSRADEGGRILAITHTDNGRVFTVLREGVLSCNGGTAGLTIDHVHEHDVHRCENGCGWDPTRAGIERTALRLFRRLHVAVGGDRRRRPTGPITPNEAALLHAAIELEKWIP